MGFSDLVIRHSPGNNRPESISVIAPYSNMILTVNLCILFLIKHYILEPYLPHVYAHIWGPSSDLTKRAILTLHLAILTRIFLLAVAFYPFAAITFGSSKISDPVGIFWGRATMGDCLIFAMNVLPSFYLFEIIHRSGLSIATWSHHVGTILTAQGTATLVTSGHASARYQFLVIVMWGFFDVIMELGPTFALIRLRSARGDHEHLRQVFKYTALWVFILNNIQTVLVVSMFRMIWDEWALALKVVTPLVYMIFTALQWQQAYLYRVLMKRELKEHLRKIALKEVEGHALSSKEEMEKERDS